MWTTIPTPLSPATRQISFILQFFVTTGYSTLTWRFWILFSEDYLKQKGERNGRNRSLHALLVACPELRYSCTQASKCLLLSASFLTIAVQLVRNSLVFRFAIMSILVLCKLEQDFRTKQEPCSASLTSDIVWAENPSITRLEFLDMSVMPTDQPHCQDSLIDPYLFWEGSVRWKGQDVGRRQLTSQCSSAYIPQEKGHPELPRVGRAHACSVLAAMVEVLCSDQSLWTHAIFTAALAPLGTALPPPAWGA